MTEDEFEYYSKPENQEELHVYVENLMKEKKEENILEEAN